MRILHVTDCYLPRLGGIEGHVSDLVARQRAAGHDAGVVTMTPGGRDVPDPEWVRRVGGCAVDGSRSLLRADAALEDLLHETRPDVAHVHVSVFSPFATVAARRTGAAGVPTLVTVHSMWSRLGPLPGLARATLRLRDRPITWSAVSDAAAQPLRRMLGPDVDVFVLPNAVEPREWRADPAPPEPGRTPTLLSVMRLTRTKRTLPLARMLRDVRAVVPDDVPLRAVVVGDGPQRSAFERYLARHRMTDWVELTGRLDRSEVRDRMAAADCFVAPADLESFGIAALEARAMGLPVVASRQSGVGEFVRPGQEGLLAGTDEEMVRAIARLILDPDLLERMRRHNLRVPIEHDWVAACARTERLYERAILQSPARAPRPHRWSSLSSPPAPAPGP